MFKASLLFALGTLVSRVFGIVRESVTAGVFGASLALDAFLVANRIPNMLREMLAEGALGSSFTKVYSELWEKNRQRALTLLGDALLFCALLSLIVCTLGMLAAPLLVESMTLMKHDPQQQSDFYHQTVGLTRLLFPFIGMMTLGAIASGALHQKGRFFTSAASPIALNVGYLIGALLFTELLTAHGPDWISTYIAGKAITGLALGVLLGGFMQLCIQLAGIWRPYLSQIRNWPHGFPWSADVKKVFVLMGPMVIASSAGQINVLVNTNFATSLATGAVTWLTFSFRILQLPIGLFAVAIGSVALPSLTRAVVASRQQNHGLAGVGRELQQAVEWMMWLMAPCACFFLASALPVTQLLYQHGAYSASDTVATSDALYFYSFSLMGYGLIKVLTAYYYAVDKTRFAMNVSLIGIVVNYTANYFLVDAFGHHGLAMTSSVVLTVNALLLFGGLKGQGLAMDRRQFAHSAILLLFAFACAYGGQKLCGLAFAPSGPSAGLPLKLRAGAQVLVNGALVGMLFLAFGLLRLRKTPYGAWKSWRSHRRPGKG